MTKTRKSMVKHNRAVRKSVVNKNDTGNQRGIIRKNARQRDDNNARQKCIRKHGINKNMMNTDITYKEEKTFTQEQVQELFLSVGWVSGEYPQRLYKALMNSSTVITAWSGDKLVGLARVLDDSEMVAFVHYVLVNPHFQGMGIAGKMIELIKEKYKNYLYIDVMPEERSNAPFYEKHGFNIMEDGVAMTRINYADKR